MNTTTHALLALVGFQRKKIGRSGWAALAGSLLPDAFLAVFIVAMFIGDVPTNEIWDIKYFQEPWTTLGSVSNSFPVWFCLLALGLVLKWRDHGAGNLLTIFGLSGLSHLILDFFTHADDAHQHFWPLGSWRFESPVSYWDVEHNAALLMPIEGLLSLYAVKVLWQRTNATFFKVLLVLLSFVGFVLILSPLLRFLS